MEYINVIEVRNTQVVSCRLFKDEDKDAVAKRAEDYFVKLCGEDLTEDEKNTALDDGFWTVGEVDVYLYWPEMED